MVFNGYGKKNLDGPNAYPEICDGNPPKPVTIWIGWVMAKCDGFSRPLAQNTKKHGFDNISFHTQNPTLAAKNPIIKQGVQVLDVVDFQRTLNLGAQPRPEANYVHKLLVFFKAQLVRFLAANRPEKNMK